MKKTIIMTLSLSTALLMGGCSGHKNPLSNADKAMTAQFLVHASQYAEKKINIFHEPGGDAYGQCQAGKLISSTCVRLYDAMVTYAQSTNFKGLQEQDLKNNTSWTSLKDEYNKIQFNQI